MNRALRAVRWCLGEETITLYTRGTYDATQWHRLDDGVEGLLSSDDASAMRWEPEGERAGLAALTLFDQASYLVSLTRGLAFADAMAPLLDALPIETSNVRCWSLDARGHAGSAALQLRSRTRDYVLALEFRTRLLPHLDAWRAMLDALASIDLALATRDLASTNAGWTSVEGRSRSDAQMLAALAFLIESGRVGEAVAQLHRSPTSQLVSERSSAPIDRAWNVRPEHLAISPRAGAFDRVPVIERAFTRDTAMNRFVLAVLDEMLRHANHLARSNLTATQQGYAAAVATTLEAIVDTLRATTFRGIVTSTDDARITPQGIERYGGYREIAAMKRFLDAAPRVLATSDGERLGLHDAPRLYERWCALAVLDALGVASEDCAAAFESGEARTRVDGCDVTIAMQQSAGRASYSLDFRPDITVHAGGLKLHLDAKFRHVAGARGRDDVLTKMHAYRDAITGTYAAVALYPGLGAAGASYDAPGGGGIGLLALHPGGDEVARAAQRDALCALLRRFLRAASREHLGV